MHSVKMTGPEVELFASIVWRLRSAETGPSVREQVLGDLAQLLRADFAASYIWDSRLNRSLQGTAINIEASRLRDYEQRVHLHDRITPLLRARRRATRVDEVISRRELEQGAHYREFLQPCGMHHGINLFVFDQERDLGDFRVWRGAGQPAFGQREVCLLDALNPYLQQALVLEAGAAPLLTAREQRVAGHVAQGCSDKQIARLMNIGFTTVRTHLKNAMAKTGARNRTELALWRARHGAPPQS